MTNDHGCQWRWDEFESGAEKIVVVSLHFFGSASTISRFGERVRDGQNNLVSFLFAVFLLAVPPCPVICKRGGHVPPPVPHVVGAGCNVSAD